MQRLKVSCALRRVYMSLGAKGLNPAVRKETASLWERLINNKINIKRENPFI